MSNTVLILANSAKGLINFRKELLIKLVDENYNVFVSVPDDEAIGKIEDIGCRVEKAPVNRRGTNIFQEFKLIKHYYRIIKKIQPDIVLTYTIKPNIYGGILAKYMTIPYLPNVTGLGTALNNESILKRILIKLYKYSFSGAKTIFFQNTTNKKFFCENNIINNTIKTEVLPGSGVNLEEYHLLEYPQPNKINFVFISRIMKDKGIEHYLKAAQYFQKKYSNINFHICGYYEDNYEEIIDELHNKKVIIYHGAVSDVRLILKNMHCIVHPSYHEGMSNVLLEAASSGRPIIASDIPGCRETFDEGISGFSFPKKDTAELIKTLDKFIRLDYKKKKKMGFAGRKKMETEFNRQIVVDSYIEEINKVLEEKK